MARPLNLQRREGILKVAKRLFADKGFAATSMSDIVKLSGYPVGSIYTYFKNKEDLIRTIIEEGWAGFHNEMATAMRSLPTGRERIDTLINDFLPKLLEDEELVGILLTEGLQYADIRAKIDALTRLVIDAIVSIDPAVAENASATVFPQRTIAAGIVVFVLGVLDASRFTARFDLGVNKQDILDFIRRLVANSNLIATA